MTRVLTALALVPLALAAVLWAPLWLFAFLVMLLGLFALREFYDLAQAQGLEPYRWLGLGLAAVLALTLELPLAEPFAVAVFPACVLAVLAGALAHRDRLPQAPGDAGATLVGILYLGGFMGLTGAVRLWGSGWMLYLLAVVWLGDTAALYAGHAWGRHPMAPLISPKKTWEGAAASLIAAGVTGALFGHFALGDPVRLSLLALVLNLAAQAGDLVESVWKRAAHVKDSGALLPGHGGVLDRMDALLFAGPVLWYYLMYFRP